MLARRPWHALQPLLRAVQEAPLEYIYKTEIVPLITECLIKAIETHTMDVGLVKPERPGPSVKARADLERYDAEMNTYDHQAEAVRRKAVDLAMRQGWVLVDYFYEQIGVMEKNGISLKGKTWVRWSTAWMSIANATRTNRSPSFPKVATMYCAVRQRS